MSSTTTFHAPDIHCGGCASAIQRALSAREGVEGVAVDVAQKAVTVQYAEEKVGAAELLAALERAGFPARERAASAAPDGSAPASCHA